MIMIGFGFLGWVYRKTVLSMLEPYARWLHKAHFHLPVRRVPDHNRRAPSIVTVYSESLSSTVQVFEEEPNEAINQSNLMHRIETVLVVLRPGFLLYLLSEESYSSRTLDIVFTLTGL